MYHIDVLCCTDTGCAASKSAELVTTFEEAIRQYGLDGEVRIIKTGCFGFCQKGPLVAVYPDQVFYCHVKKEDVERIVGEHLCKGRICSDLQLSDTDPASGETITEKERLGFYAKQKHIALHNCGRIDPEGIHRL